MVERKVYVARAALYLSGLNLFTKLRDLGVVVNGEGFHETITQLALLTVGCVLLALTRLFQHRPLGVPTMLPLA